MLNFQDFFENKLTNAMIANVRTKIKKFNDYVLIFDRNVLFSLFFVLLIWISNAFQDFGDDWATKLASSRFHYRVAPPSCWNRLKFWTDFWKRPKKFVKVWNMYDISLGIGAERHNLLLQMCCQSTCSIILWKFSCVREVSRSALS